MYINSHAIRSRHGRQSKAFTVQRSYCASRTCTSRARQNMHRKTHWNERRLKCLAKVTVIIIIILLFCVCVCVDNSTHCLCFVDSFVLLTLTTFPHSHRRRRLCRRHTSLWARIYTHIIRLQRRCRQPTRQDLLKPLLYLAHSISGRCWSILCTSASSPQQQQQQQQRTLAVCLFMRALVGPLRLFLSD